jgi:beta-galactosidase/beta-glucuronidase
MNEYPGSRRRFLKHTSLGMAGLALTRVPLRVFAADNSDPTQARSKANGPFAPVRYRPMATRVTGLRQNSISLNGTWRIDPKPDQNVREKHLNAASWGNLQVPGQWVQQGYDIPQDKTAALAKEFMVPAQWSGYRIFLRFDAIHGGTHYWLNGRPLGYSENLFTPVEWEITDAVKVGQTNRLDLEMMVATTSERLSSSSAYTGYSLGGIDRAVRIYALPKIHVSTLHLNAGLDKKYRDGELQIALGIDNPNQNEVHGFSIAVQIMSADGKPVEHSTSRIALAPLMPGMNPVDVESRVPNPLKWNAEQPNLYKLVLVLLQNGRVLGNLCTSSLFTA